MASFVSRAISPTSSKNHLSQALAHEACRRGYEILFVDTAKTLAHLAGGRAEGSHEQRLARYTRPDLLVIDDFGLKPLGTPGPEDLYDVINERYEKASSRAIGIGRSGWTCSGSRCWPRRRWTASSTAFTSSE